MRWNQIFKKINFFEVSSFSPSFYQCKETYRQTFLKSSASPISGFTNMIRKTVKQACFQCHFTVNISALFSFQKGLSFIFDQKVGEYFAWHNGNSVSLWQNMRSWYSPSVTSLWKDYTRRKTCHRKHSFPAYRHIWYLSGGNYKPWIARIATNKAKDYLNSAYSRRVMLASSEEDSVETLASDQANWLLSATWRDVHFKGRFRNHEQMIRSSKNLTVKFVS